MSHLSGKSFRLKLAQFLNFTYPQSQKDYYQQYAIESSRKSFSKLEILKHRFAVELFLAAYNLPGTKED
jgi:hypothetical protein